jgi:hypothetical protein
MEATRSPETSVLTRSNYTAPHPKKTAFFIVTVVKTSKPYKNLFYGSVVVKALCY